MLLSPTRVVGLLVALLAAPAFARFGKGSSGSSHAGSTSHGAAPVGSRSSTSSSTGTSSSGGLGSTGGTGTLYSPQYSPYGGFYTGLFVPHLGYHLFHPGYQPPGPQEHVEPTEPPLRMTLNVEGMPYIATEKGGTIAVGFMAEGERFGVSAWAQSVIAQAKDGSGETDYLPQVNAHVTYAFLTGTYGRLRAELGLDVVFAHDANFFGPTAGLSGSLWLGGPFALEGAAFVTPFPYQQVDGRLGLAIGLGPMGLRVGWRLQVLDDRGMIDGVVNRDVFTGPYAGVAMVF